VLELYRIVVSLNHHSWWFADKRIHTTVEAILFTAQSSSKTTVIGRLCQSAVPVWVVLRVWTHSAMFQKELFYPSTSKTWVLCISAGFNRFCNLPIIHP